MTWKTIMVPLAGADNDAKVLDAGRLVAEAFGAELAAVHAPADIADLMPWMGEGFMGGVQISAIESLKEAALEGARIAAKACTACPRSSARGDIGDFASTAASAASGIGAATAACARGRRGRSRRP